MKVLYVAYRYDPRDPDLGSGSDYSFYSAIKRHGIDIEILGPFSNKPVFGERVIEKFYRKVTHKRYLKDSISSSWLASRVLNQAVKLRKPDVIFTLFLPPMVFYTGNVPCVFRVDATFRGLEEAWPWPLYGKLALSLSFWQENRVYRNCSKVITHSEWTRNILINQYGLDVSRIEMFPRPSELPPHVVPDRIDIGVDKRLETPLRLLVVSRTYELKGTDIAIEVTRQLNTLGIPTQLTVCGLSPRDIVEDPNVKYVGPYKKANPEQLAQYIELYRRAHFLVHPARYEGAGIVPGEAAAFGTPTITNNAGALATTVKDGVSGIVLSKGSTPGAYTKVITGFLNDPEKYYDLCVSTRQRYEQELNWDVAGERLISILREVVSN
jgi:glycosyltransferase involved in cell wall biosynthesis